MEFIQVSQSAFDRLVESIDTLRRGASERKDWQTVKDATRIQTLVYNYLGTLIAEGKVTNPREPVS